LDASAINARAVQVAVFNANAVQAGLCTEAFSPPPLGTQGGGTTHEEEEAWEEAAACLETPMDPDDAAVQFPTARMQVPAFFERACHEPAVGDRFASLLRRRRRAARR
jgi:hypothetical protein